MLLALSLHRCFEIDVSFLARTLAFTWLTVSLLSESTCRDASHFIVSSKDHSWLARDAPMPQELQRKAVGSDFGRRLDRVFFGAFVSRLCR